MKTHICLPLIFALAAVTVCGQERILPTNLKGPGANYEANVPEGFQRLALGDAPPDFNLIGVDDKFHSLDEYKGGKVLMIVWLSNHCPYSHAQETRMIPVVKKYMSKGLKVVSIQPNTPLPENATGLAYSKYNDSFEEMKLYAKENNFPFDYLYDGDTQETSKAYGALATPHVFLFDKDLKLRYAGRWDDGRFEEADSVTNNEGQLALDAMMADKPVPVPFSKPLGCAVKWNTPDDKAMAGYRTPFKHEPITIDEIDPARIAALAANPTKKMRLFTVWATTSLTSMSKLPDLSGMSQRLDRRDFEVITISLDSASARGAALDILQREHLGMPTRIKKTLEAEGRTTNNYIVKAGTTAADVAKALDPRWPGAPLPHTVLIAPNGKVLWRYTGAGYETVGVVRQILDELGGFFPKVDTVLAK